MTFQASERRQFAQWTEVFDPLGHLIGMASQISIEPGQSPAVQLACLTQQIMEYPLGIRQVFESRHVRNGKVFAPPSAPAGPEESSDCMSSRSATLLGVTVATSS